MKFRKLYKKNVHTNLGVETSNPINVYKNVLCTSHELLLETMFCDLLQPLSYGSDECYFG